MRLPSPRKVDEISIKISMPHERSDDPENLMTLKKTMIQSFNSLLILLYNTQTHRPRAQGQQPDTNVVFFVTRKVMKLEKIGSNKTCR